MTLLISIFAFIVAVSVIVSFHEYGHFWTARRFGVKVLRYSIGFGRPLWRRRGQDGTEYMVAAIPLGGYVKMLDEREGPVDGNELHRAFNRKPLHVRTAVVAAGPAFNFILAFLLYYLMFMVGVSGVRPIVGEIAPDGVAARSGIAPGDRFTEIAGEPVESWQQVLLALLDAGFSAPSFGVSVVGADGAERRLVLDTGGVNMLEDDNLLGQLGIEPRVPKVEPVVGEVMSGTGAARADLRPGDRIVSFAGEDVEGWDALVKSVQAHPRERVVLEVVRDGARFDVAVDIGVSRGDGAGYIGVRPRLPETGRYVSFVRYGPFESLRLALDKTWQVTALTVGVVKRLLLGGASLGSISGPVGIAEYAGLSLLQGFGTFLGLLALLSVSIGILNLLPVPMLDGGHLLYYLVEFIRGKPLSLRAQLIGQWVGIFMLACLLALALYNDFTRLFG